MSGSPKNNGYQTRVDNLDLRLGRAERTSRLNNAAISSGGLKIQDSGLLTVRETGSVRLRDSSGQQVWESTQDATQDRVVIGSDSGLSFTSSFTFFGWTEKIPVDVHSWGGPYWIRIDFQAQATISALSNFSVYGAARSHYTDGSVSSAFYLGGGANTGTSLGPSTAQGFYVVSTDSILNSNGVDFAGFSFGVYVAVGGTATPGTGSWYVVAEQVSRRTNALV